MRECAGSGGCPAAGEAAGAAGGWLSLVRHVSCRARDSPPPSAQGWLRASRLGSGLA